MIEDGNDIEAISKAIASARNETSRPSLIQLERTSLRQSE